jgi:hypothetical protein
MAVGPILGYVSQYRLIKFTKSVGSFSIDICGILLFANILRLNFYIFKQYESALVFQSLFMIGMQVYIIWWRFYYYTNVASIQLKISKKMEQYQIKFNQLYQNNNVDKKWNNFGDGKVSKNLVYI